MITERAANDPGDLAPRRRSAAFLASYALANAGGVIAYFPLLALLLPIKVEATAGADRLTWFTLAVVVGSLTASGSNILFGWLSDRAVARGGGRRRWIGGGAIAVALSLGAVSAAASPATIVLAVASFQVAVNALLAPLAALMAEEIPDEQKSFAGGLTSLGLPVASGFAVLVIGMTSHESVRLLWVAVAVAVCVAPLLMTRRHRIERPPAADATRLMDRDLVIAWAGRLLVQIAGCVLSLYLLFYFEGIAAASGDLSARVSRLLAIGAALPVPVALVFGRMSDLIARRKPFLLTAALIAAGGLLIMMVARDWATGATGFAIYTVGAATFLALHSGFAMQMLPRPDHRGRDLGFYNLSNTLPATVGPLLTWSLAMPGQFAPVMLVLALLTAIGGLTICGVRERP